MSTFSRMHDAYLTPQEGTDPHPWSEELCGILEEAGLTADQYHHACNLFDKAIAADPVVIVTTDDLFMQASMCREFDQNHAVFWRNSTGRHEIVDECGYAAVMCKVMDTLRGDALTEEAEAVADYLSDLLDDDAFERASKVLQRVKRIHALANNTKASEAGQGVDEAMVERAMAAREPIQRTLVVDHFFSRGRIPVDAWDGGRLVIRAILKAATHTQEGRG